LEPLRRAGTLTLSNLHQMAKTTRYSNLMIISLMKIEMKLTQKRKNWKQSPIKERIM
jgi:hypothetical protein